jgi:hypothetical protein
MPLRNLFPNPPSIGVQREFVRASPQCIHLPPSPGDRQTGDRAICAGPLHPLLEADSSKILEHEFQFRHVLCGPAHCLIQVVEKLMHRSYPGGFYLSPGGVQRVPVRVRLATYSSMNDASLSQAGGVRRPAVGQKSSGVMRVDCTLNVTNAWEIECTARQSSSLQSSSLPGGAHTGRRPPVK